MVTILLLVRATYIRVLFFAHIPFLVNRTFNATPIEVLQHLTTKLEGNDETVILFSKHFFGKCSSYLPSNEK